MSTPSTVPRLASVQEDLSLEESATEKHEYVDGQIVPLGYNRFTPHALPGGTYFHGLIAANFNGEVKSRLKGKPCRVVDSNVRVRIEAGNHFLYPEGMVICGEPQFAANDLKKNAVLNPKLVVEVLSDSTEAYDRGAKFTAYRSLESLEEYVLIWQHQASVETCLRKPDGTWSLAYVNDLAASVRLRSLDIEIPMADIYADV